MTNSEKMVKELIDTVHKLNNPLRRSLAAQSFQHTENGHTMYWCADRLHWLLKWNHVDHDTAGWIADMITEYYEEPFTPIPIEEARAIHRANQESTGG